MFGAGCEVTLARGLRAEEADELSSELNQQGVAATRAEDGPSPTRYRVDVAAGAVEKAVAALATPGPWRSPPEVATSEAPLVPSRRTEQQRLAQDQARELSRSLELLPGVLRARVHLNLPLPAASLADPIDAPAAAEPSAAVLLLTAGPRSPQLQTKVRALLSGAVPGLRDSAIRVVETARERPGRQCAELVRIGPISVTRASAASLKLWLGLALAADMLLAAALLFVLQRQGRRAQD